MERKLQSSLEQEEQVIEDSGSEVLRPTNRAIATYIQAVFPGLSPKPGLAPRFQDVKPIKLIYSYFIQEVGLFKDASFSFGSDGIFKEAFGLLVNYRQDVPENYVKGNFSRTNLAQRGGSILRFSLDGDQAFLHCKSQLNKKEITTLCRRFKMTRAQLLEMATPLRSKEDEESLITEGRGLDWYELIDYVLFELHKQDPAHFPNPVEFIF